MNNNYISLIALIVAVFFSGIYLRGEGARKKELKRELDVIRDQQEQIIAQVGEINRLTAERDQLLLSRIDSARTYIDILNAEEKYTSQQIAKFGDNIELLQEGIDQNLTRITGSEGLTVTPSAGEVISGGQ
ncbi:MAG: hypothetical protein AB8G77_11825 [Rhodothermales bacterium]